MICEEKKRIIGLYSFYPFSPTIHRLLMYGTSFTRHCIMPIGTMSEEVQEAWNKFVKNYRWDKQTWYSFSRFSEQTMLFLKVFQKYT